MIVRVAFVECDTLQPQSTFDVTHILSMTRATAGMTASFLFGMYFPVFKGPSLKFYETADLHLDGAGLGDSNEIS